VGPLDERSARLVKLGIAIGAQAEEELRPGRPTPLTTIGFPHTVAGLGWIEEVIESTS
jgi:hypothetical protein